MLQPSMFDVPVQPKSNVPYVGKYIYETRGKAREYRELACNLYTGCDHKCAYCYAPSVLQRDRQNFYDAVNPRPGVIEAIQKESKRYVECGDTRQVLFCFTCDPYNNADVKYKLTRQAIIACHNNGMPICTLTKGGFRALRDIDLFTAQDSFASTLTCLDPDKSLLWEPGAALPQERFDTLKKFHSAGIPTWVSLEPVIDPEWTKQIIMETHEYVDEFKVGILNYHPRSKEIDWRQFGYEVKELLDNLGCKYYLKRDLRILL